MASYQPGDLAFVQGRDPVGRLISRATLSPYTHVRVIVTPDGHCVEAVPPRVALGMVLATDTIVEIAYGSAAERREATQRALSFLGERYGYLAYLSDVLGMCGFPISFQVRKTLICSQLAARAIGLGIDQQDTTPGLLYTLLTTTIERTTPL